MSKRNKKSRASNTPASTAPASDLTVVDGNAVGIAPEGGEGDAGTEVIEVANDDAEIAELAEPVVADDVLAALAADENDAPATVIDSDEPTITADDVDEPTEDEVLAAIDASGNTGTKPRTPRAPKTPAAPTREFTAVAQIDQATLDANLAGCNAKKVKEKAENLIAAVTHGKGLSRYTKLAVSELLANGRISGKSMTDRFKTEGLSEGTARAQAQQMTALFKLVGAVAPDATNPRDLTVQDNGLVQELAKLAA